MSDKIQNEPDISILDRVLKIVAGQSRHNRKMITALIVSIIFDIALSVAAVGFVVHFYDTSAQEQLSSCHAGNGFRTADKKMWEYVLARGPAHPTGKQAEVIHNFQLYLNGVMAPRSCK
jgi:hypothetical protein